MDTFVLPVPILRRLLRLLVEEAPPRCFLTVGTRDTAEHRHWLARGVSATDPIPPAQAFEVRVTESWGEHTLESLPQTSPAMAGLMLLGAGPSRGQVSVGAVREGRLTSISLLALVGPGMHTIDLRPRSTKLVLPTTADLARDEADRERWSRTIGALGGEQAWRRLIGLRVAVIGAGRSGSLAAQALVRVGVRHVTVLDPDVVERHNLGESDVVGDCDVGLPKALAVARRLGVSLPSVESSVDGVAASIWERRGIDVAKGSDVLFSCVDSDGARLAAALIAAAHHRVIVDVGTGVFFNDPGGSTLYSVEQRPRLGADVRVILPGDGCLVCRGGLRDYDRALLELTGQRPTAPQSPGSTGEFSGRAGSLRSLNMMAVGAALRKLEGVVAANGRGGWLRLEDDGTGKVEIACLDPVEGESDSRGPSGCPVCARAGLGDAMI